MQPNGLEARPAHPRQPLPHQRPIRAGRDDQPEDEGLDDGDRIERKAPTSEQLAQDPVQLELLPQLLQHHQPAHLAGGGHLHVAGIDVGSLFGPGHQLPGQPVQLLPIQLVFPPQGDHHPLVGVAPFAVGLDQLGVSGTCRLSCA